MSIDPNLITTVSVGELPPNPISSDNNIPHEVDGVLSRATIQELVNYLRSQSSAYRYEVKIIRTPNYGYISDNFDMTPGETQGLGKSGGLWEGWAIMNGNNGTDNMDGRVIMGYGENYGIVGFDLGEETHTLNINEIPSHNHAIPIYNNDTTGGNVADASGTQTGTKNTNSVGGGLPHNNIQPSKVLLMIMKII